VLSTRFAYSSSYRLLNLKLTILFVRFQIWWLKTSNSPHFISTSIYVCNAQSFADHLSKAHNLKASPFRAIRVIILNLFTNNDVDIYRFKFLLRGSANMYSELNMFIHFFCRDEPSPFFNDRAFQNSNCSERRSFQIMSFWQMIGKWLGIAYIDWCGNKMRWIWCFQSSNNHLPIICQKLIIWKLLLSEQLEFWKARSLKNGDGSSRQKKWMNMLSWEYMFAEPRSRNLNR
jgi:hypothetical protein